MSPVSPTVVFAGLALLAGPAFGAQTINPAGGNTAVDGLRITIGENTQLQIRREGSGQLYSPGTLPPSRSIFNSVFLAEGTTISAGDSSVLTLMSGTQTFSNVSQTLVTGTGVTGDPYTVVTTVRTNAGATLTMSVYYTAPDQYFIVSIDVEAAPGNTSPMKLYHMMDTYLAGSDSGPAYVDDPTNPTIVGVARNGIYEAFVQLTDPWDYYYSANYAEQFRQTSLGGDLRNNLDFSNTDNGIGVQWNLGTLTGSRTISYVLAFTDINFSSIDADGDTVIDLIEGTVNDTDGDLIPNYLDPDDDGDGTLTRNEDNNGDGRPGNDDADGDGIADYLEEDADDDGLDDQVERNGVTDPYDADSDDDGLVDGAEVNLHRTNPLDPNSDDDCATDGAEVAAGTSPLSSASDSGDADGDGICDDADLCFGDDTTGDSDEDGFCDDADPCFGNNAAGDADEDGVCDDNDLCFGDDATGDSDGDGVCDNLDLCDGDDATGDTDGDGICDDNDSCVGDDTTGDSDGDGVCDNLDLCVGDDATGDADGDGICDDTDSCFGDDTTGDSDEDGVCDDADLCRGNDAAGDADEDGICADNEVCWGDFDRDGYPNIFVPIVPVDEMCDDPGEVDIDAPVPPDCNDEDARIYPTANELPADGVDSNCDSQELCYVDLDHDSWGSDDTTLVDLGFLYKALGGSCEAPSWDLSARSGDCDDTNPFAYPGAFEVVANGVDESCDRTELCWLDNDDDGWLPFGEVNNRAPRGMPRGLPQGPPPGTIVSVDLDCTDTREGGDTTPVGDCDDNNAAVYPNATEIPNNGVDEDCDQDDLGTTCGTDLDDDGWRTGELLLSADEDCDDPGEVSLIAPGVDCDDTNPNIYPGAMELVGDGVSQDCDATELCWMDADDDGWRPIGAMPLGLPQAPPGTVISFDLDCEDPGEAPEGTPTGDCNDQDPAINPTATDIPVDQIDQNCDGRDGGRFCFADVDNDGWRVEATVVSVDDDCDDPGEALPEDPAIDCDDTNAAIYPTAPEIPNDGIDQDCNQDDLGRTCYVDADGDTWRLDTTLVSADEDCDDPGEAWDDNPAFDCDDSDAATYPGAAEIPNDGIDQDCNEDDLGRLCYVDADGDAWRTHTVIPSADEDCDDPGEAPATVSAVDCDDSDDTVYPGATEIPNDGVDQDCLDGDLGRACFVDADDDGWRVAATVLSVDEDCDDPGEADDQAPGPDCDDTNAQIYPGATDLPGDGIDQDCQGGDAALLCYTDADNDGWRIDALVGSADADCDDPGEADDQDPALDCDDTDPNTYPGATEIPGDRSDNDCDGGIECYVDIDGDSWRVDAVIGSIDGDCDDDGEATDEDPALDCDDADADVYPGATEVPGTGIDADCDGGELCYVNADGDAWRLTTTVVSDDPDCDDPGEAYEIDPAEDCDDTNADIYPGATDVPGDQVDQDCNGDDATMDCAVDADGDGWRTAATIASADFDCDDPGEAPMDAPAEDCDDSDPLVYPGAAELIDDGTDQDCDTEELCFVDADGDVWRTDAVVTSVDLDCDDPGEAHEDTPSVDCDDTNATVNPGAEEIAADGIDQDCDGEELCLVDADEDGLRLDDGATLTSDDGDCDDPGEATEDVPPLDCDDSSADADADGLSDADEVLSLQTDACDPDSDDDELTDGEEVNEHNTDPLLPDTDEGGTPDGEEVTRGSDPLDELDDDLPRRWYQGRYACDTGAPAGSMAAVLLALGALRRRRVLTTPVRSTEGGDR